MKSVALLNEANRVPLVVDLDGTVVKTDTLLESLFILLKRKFLFAFILPFWLMKGKGFLKHQIAKHISLDVSRLPYNLELLAFLQKEHSKGRTLVLATAADYSIACKVADHLSIFSSVLASTPECNLKGLNKLKVLLDKFGEKGFDYAGNENVDLKIWTHANGGVVVNGSERLVKEARKVTNISHVFNCQRNKFGIFLKAIRIHQWVKNLLIYAPLILAHKVMDYSVWLNGLYAFSAFSILASSVYLLNDLLDIENDRHHHEKRYRPLASGDLSISAGIITAFLFFIAGITISLLLPLKFLFVLGVYYIITLAYSLYLKQVVLVDVITLALLYTTRIIAGGVATDVNISQWLLAFSVFIFTSLAFAKRYSELHNLRKSNKEASRGRGYFASDLEQLANFGTAGGYIAVMVLALYINSPEVKGLYKHPDAIWLICPLFLYWISRIWLFAHRGQMHEDPIVFAVKDRATYLIGLGVIGIIIIAAI